MLHTCRTRQGILKHECAVSGREMLHRLASREGSNDNCLYYPTFTGNQQEDFYYFQRHWAKGEPVIVRNTLESSTGLSWEPMVMWRALCENGNSDINLEMSEVKAIDCLAGCEVSSYKPLSFFFLKHSFQDYAMFNSDFDILLYRWGLILANFSKAILKGEVMITSGLKCSS